MRGRTRTLVAVVLAVVPLVALAACSSSGDGKDGDGGAASGSTTQPADNSGLVGQPWNLVSYTAGNGEAPPTVQGRDAVLQFAEDGSLSGTTGCNNFAGTFTTKGSSLTISLGPMTRRACTDPALTAQEAALTTGLAQVTSYTVDGSTLVLKVGTAERFTYSAEDTSLVGGWKVTGLNNGKGGLESSAATQSLVLMFTEDQLTARGDCNTLTANYSTTGEEPLSFGPVSSTKKACEGDGATADEWMTAALGRTTDYEVVGGTLTLRAADGAMQVTATRG